MPTVHEVASITSKGQITLPKAIRQLLDISVGGKVAFDLRGDEVVISKVPEANTYHDPAIGAFLNLLENDIKAGNLLALPQDLMQSMLAHLPSSPQSGRTPGDSLSFELDDDIVGEVDL